MKNTHILSLIALLCIPVLILSGCSLWNPVSERELPDIPLASYEKDNAPSQMIKTTNQWVSLINSYGSSDYAISVSDTADTLNPVYSVKDVGIWFFEASDEGVVWCEKSKEHYTYKFYRTSDAQLIDLYKTENATDFQPQNIAIYDQTVYYCVLDYEQSEATLYAYDIAKETTHIVKSVSFTDEHLPHSFAVEENFITMADSKTVIVLDRTSYEIVKTYRLPDNIKRIFAVSYDAANDTCALYYSDEDSADIGMIDPQNDGVISLFTFAENHYAYHDILHCADGHLYWINQANVSGYTADHYRLIDYDYQHHRSVETPMTFSFHEQNGDMYILRFDQSKEYSAIELYEYD